MSKAPSTKSKQTPARKSPAWRWWLWLVGGVVALGLVLIVSLVALSGRVVTLSPAITDRVEARANEALGQGVFSIGQIDLEVDENFVPRMTARNIGVLDATGAEVARFNALKLTLAGGALRLGRIEPEQIRLSGAEIIVRRDVDGRFSMDFGGGSQSTASLSQIMGAFARSFELDPLSQLTEVVAEDVTLTLEDARSGRIWQTTDTRLRLLNNGPEVVMMMVSEIFNGTEDLFPVRMRVVSQKQSLDTSVTFDISDMPSTDFAIQSPELSFLSVIRAPLSAQMEINLAGDGTLGRYGGTLELGRGFFRPDQTTFPIPFGGASGRFEFDPVTQAVGFQDLQFSAQALDLIGRGQVILNDDGSAFPQSYVGQFALKDVSIDPDGIYDNPADFDDVAIEFKMDLDPFEIEFGQVSVSRDTLSMSAKGYARTVGDKWQAGMDLSIPSADFQELLGFWPLPVLPKPRAWMVGNVLEGQLKDIDVAFRIDPDKDEPVYHIDWVFEDLALKFMKAQPPIEGAKGYGTIVDHRMTVVMDDGYIEAPSNGRIEMAGSVLAIEDLRIVPGQLVLDIQSRSTIEAALSAMALKPFSILDNAGFEADVATGMVDVTGYVSFPVKQIIPFEEIEFSALGIMQDVVSDKLMEGFTIAAERLELEATPDGLRLGGEAKLGEVDVSGNWRKWFGEEFAGVSSVKGEITLGQALLDTFNIQLPKGTLQGETKGRIEVALENGTSPQFEITSPMAGLQVAIPPLGWRKTQEQIGELRVVGALGETAEISSISFDAAGLKAQDGVITLKEGGAFESLSFERVTLSDWIDTGLKLKSQGKGAPLLLTTSGGRADLRRLRPSGGSNGGTGLDMSLAFDRVIVADNMTLSGFTSNLNTAGGLNGTLSGTLNGRAPITGTITKGQYGPGFVIETPEAARALMALDLIEKAEQGTLKLALTARPERGSYDGNLEMENLRILSAPSLAELLSILSIAGLLDQLGGGEGIMFSNVESDFSFVDGTLSVKQGIAEGPSLGISLSGDYDTNSKQLDMDGVISPLYFVNALGQVVSRRGEGLFGFTYTLKGSADAPKVGANPLSIILPGFLREIFRKQPSEGSS